MFSAIGYLAILIGLTSIWLARTSNWGWALGVVSTLFWYCSAIPLHEWTIVASATAYGAVDLFNFIINLRSAKIE